MMRKYVNNGNKLSCLDLNVAFQTLYFRLFSSSVSAALVIVNWRYNTNQDRKGWPSSDIQMYMVVREE